MPTEVVSPVIGVALTTTTTGTTTDGVNAKFKLGTRVVGSENTEWVYVQAGAAVTQYDTVLINEDFQMVPITTTLATEASGDAGSFVGFAQVAFSDNDLGWVATKGSNINARGVAATTADVMLYTTATAGVLATASVGVLINGVVFVAAVSASSGEIIASNPLSRLAAALAS